MVQGRPYKEEDGAMTQSIKDFGARGDGVHDDSPAIRKALESCRVAGGGTLRVPVGVYRTGPIELCSHLTLILEAGSRIQFTGVFADHPPRKVRWEGVECTGYMPCIYGWDLENVSIVGPGTLDGGGTSWWQERRRRQKEKLSTPQTAFEQEFARLNAGYETMGSGGGGREMQFLRPTLIELLHSRKVTLRDFTARNSPFWNVHLVYGEDLTLDSLHIENPAEAPNGDGLSLDSCRYARVSNCHFDAGDDCLTLKSGIDADGRRVGRPTEHVTIANCTFKRGHGGVVFGSEIAGGIRNVVVTNCIFTGTDRGIRIKARRGRGGYVRDVRASNLIMEAVGCPLTINGVYRCGARADEPLFDPGARPVDETTPWFERIHVANVTARSCRASLGFFHGLPEAPVRDLTLEGLHLQTVSDRNAPPMEPDMAHGFTRTLGHGLFLKHVCQFSLRNSTLENIDGPCLKMDGVTDAIVAGLRVGAFGRPPVPPDLHGCAHVSIEPVRVAEEERPAPQP
jgi:polygalacturonase